MRNPERIKIICGLIEKAMNIWPDIRFGQLLVNCGYLKDSNEIDMPYVIDPYNYEDHKLIDALNSYINKYVQPTNTITA